MIVRDNFQIGRAALLRGLDFGRRGSAALPLVAMILFFTAGAMAETTNDLSDAEIQGRNLAQDLCDAQLAGNSTNIGILKIRDVSGKQVEIPLKCEAIVTPTNWVNIFIVGRDAHSYFSLQYFFTTTNFSSIEILTITHADSLANRYSYDYISNPDRINSTTNEDVSLASSDFRAMDLGLEFFHWPEQKILKHEMRRGRLAKSWKA